MASKTLQFQDEEARQILADVLRVMRSGGEGPMKPFLRRAAARYLGFIRTRYVAASRGDGTWPDLALSTKIKRLRRMHKGSRFARLLQATGGQSRTEQLASLAAGTKFAILRDTSTLFGSLTEGNPNAVLETRAEGIEVGTRVFYGTFHQDPTVPGRPPKREIFVDPDAATEEAIAAELAMGILVAAQEEDQPPSGGPIA